MTLNPFNPLNPPPQSLQSPHPPEPLQPYTTVLLLYYCNTILIALYLLTTILNNPIPAYWGGGENLDPMNMFGRFDLDGGGGGVVNPYPTLSRLLPRGLSGPLLPVGARSTPSRRCQACRRTAARSAVPCGKDSPGASHHSDGLHLNAAGIGIFAKALAEGR